MNTHNYKIAYGCGEATCSKAALFLMMKAGVPINKVVLYTGKPKVGKEKGGPLKQMLAFIKLYTLPYFLGMAVAPQLIPGFARRELKKHGFKNFDFKKYCKEHGIELIESTNFNKDLERIGDMDIFISLFNPHIIKQKFIDNAKIMCINFHPSDLPDFGGSDPIFQMLLNGITEAVSTGHTMTEEIDNGIMVTKERFSIAGESRFAIWWKFLFVAVRQIKQLNDDNWQYTPLEQPEVKYPYRSFPTREEIAEFKKKGHKYFKFSDFI